MAKKLKPLVVSGVLYPTQPPPSFHPSITIRDCCSEASKRNGNVFPVHNRDGRWEANYGDPLEEGCIYGYYDSWYTAVVLRDGQLWDVTELFTRVQNLPIGDRVSWEDEQEYGPSGYENVRKSGPGLQGRNVAITVRRHRTVMDAIDFYVLDGQVLLHRGAVSGWNRRWSNYRLKNPKDVDEIQALFEACGLKLV